MVRYRVVRWRSDADHHDDQAERVLGPESRAIRPLRARIASARHALRDPAWVSARPHRGPSGDGPWPSSSCPTHTVTWVVDQHSRKVHRHIGSAHGTHGRSARNWSRSNRQRPTGGRGVPMPSDRCPALRRPAIPTAGRVRASRRSHRVRSVRACVTTSAGWLPARRSPPGQPPTGPGRGDERVVVAT
jgi:hypothetical protein